MVGCAPSPPGDVRSERRRVAKLLSIFSSHANIVYLAASTSPVLSQCPLFPSPLATLPAATADAAAAHRCRRITRIRVISLMEIPAFRITDFDSSRLDRSVNLLAFVRTPASVPKITRWPHQGWLDQLGS